MQTIVDKTRADVITTVRQERDGWWVWRIRRHNRSIRSLDSFRTEREAREDLGRRLTHDAGRMAESEE